MSALIIVLMSLALGCQTNKIPPANPKGFATNIVLKTDALTCQQKAPRRHAIKTGADKRAIVVLATIKARHKSSRKQDRAKAKKKKRWVPERIPARMFGHFPR